MTVLCGCVMLPSLVCDIDPFLLNQSTRVLREEGGFGENGLKHTIKPLRGHPILPTIILMAHRKWKYIYVIFIASLTSDF